MSMSKKQKDSSQKISYEDWKKNAYEDQIEWNKVLYIWKSFKSYESQLIKSYIGLSLFGPLEGQDDINIETYYDKYDKNKKQLIDKIYKQLRYDNGRIILAQTYLYLWYNDNPRISVFRRLKPSDEIEFIDITGRVYTSWSHFVDTNELPSCLYIAPQDGIYNVNGKLKLYASPKRGIKSKVLTLGDVMASGATLGAIGLSMVAMAPVTAVSLGIAGSVYCVGRSIGTLVDRSDHRQSIAFDNMESVLSWLSIGTSAVTGVSTVGLMNSSRIIALSGEYSSFATSALKGLNYAALTSNVLNFGAYLVHFQERLRAGELSSIDIAEFCVNIFLMYGAVANVRQIHKYLNSISAPSQTSSSSLAGLTKTAKRKLQRLRAKARKNGLLPMGGTAQENIMEVGSWDTRLSQMASTSATLLVPMLMKHFPTSFQIYSRCCDIIGAVKDYRRNKLTLQAFILNVTNHVSNLYQILRNDMEKIMDTVKIHIQKIVGRVVPVRSTNQVAEIIQNGVMAVNAANEDLPEIDPLDDDVLTSDTDRTEDSKPIYEIILSSVEERVNQMCSTSNTTEEILELFTEILLSTSEEITSKIHKGYEEMLSFNYKTIGVEKTKVVLAKIGINSRKDFASKKFGEIFDELTFHSAPPSNPLAPKAITKEILAFYHELFRVLTNDDESTSNAEETAKILNRSVSIVMKPLIEKFTFAKTFYEHNASYFGTNNGKAMLIAALDLDPRTYPQKNLNDVMFVQIAREQINVSQAAANLVQKTEKSDEADISETPEFSDEFVVFHLLSLCGCFYKKIYPSRYDSGAEVEKNFRKVCYFITKKFTDIFKLLEKSNDDYKNISSKLEENNRFFNKNDFARLCQSFNEISKREIFLQVAEKFANKEFVAELIAEYRNKMGKFDDINVEIWEELVGDDGIKIHTVEMSKYSYAQKYISIAAELYGLPLHSITLVNAQKYISIAAELYGLPLHSITLVKEAENLIVLETTNKYIMFQFEENENVAFIMQVDLSVVRNLDE